MSSPINAKPVHTGSRMGIVLMVWIVLAAIGTTSASASCGDYLHDSSDHLQPGVARQPSSPNSGQRPNIPCSGPACRRSPTVPESPNPVDLQLSLTDRLANEIGMLALFESDELLSRKDDAVAFPDGYRSGLERPPRPA